MRFVRWALWVVAAILVIDAVRMAVPYYSGKPWIARAVPVVVVLRQFRSDPGVPREEVSEETTAVRADGAYVWKRVGLESHKGVVSRLIVFADGMHISVDDVAEVRSSELGEGPFTLLRDPASRCENNLLGSKASKGETLLSGASDMIGIFRTAKINSGRTTMWFAIDAGCAKVKTDLRTLHDGGTSGKYLVSLVRGEPDTQLFSVPDHYKEVPPSTVEHLRQGSSEAATRDLNYYRQRSGVTKAKQ